MNPLRDIISPQARGILYVLVTIALAGLSTWQATHGDVIEAAIAALGAAAAALAGSNLNGPDQ